MWIRRPHFFCQRRVTCACIVGWTLGTTAPAIAGQSAKLVYARSADAVSCGEESALRGAVAKRLGYDPFVAVADNTVVAELRGDGEGLRARVFVIERGNTVGGARELVSKTKRCDELMLAVALAISIAIDPEAIDRVVEESAAPVSEPEPPGTSSEVVPKAKPAPTSPRVVLPPLPPRVPLLLRIGLGGFIATGPIPSMAFGAVGDVQVERGLWSLGLEPRWWTETKTEPQSATGARASTSLSSLTVVPCLNTRGWYGCYLAELGRLVSQGEVAQSNRDVSLWAAQGLRLAYRLGPMHGLGVTAKADGLVALNRVKMLLNGSQVHETPWVSARFGLEVNYTF